MTNWSLHFICLMWALLGIRIKYNISQDLGAFKKIKYKVRYLCYQYENKRKETYFISCIKD